MDTLVEIVRLVASLALALTALVVAFDLNRRLKRVENVASVKDFLRTHKNKKTKK